MTRMHSRSNQAQNRVLVELQRYRKLGRLSFDRYMELFYELGGPSVETKAGEARMKSMLSKMERNEQI